MKPITLVIIVIALIQGCTKTEEEYTTDNSPWYELIPNNQKLKSAYKDKPLNLPVSQSDRLIFSTKFSDNTISVELYNYYIHDWECHPYLVTKNAIGENIDTLFPFTKNPYYGLDSHYNPYLEITKDARVIVTDSSCSLLMHANHQLLTLESGEEVFVLVGNETRYVSTQFCNIQPDGTFEEMQYSFNGLFTIH